MGLWETVLQVKRPNQQYQSTKGTYSTQITQNYTIIKDFISFHLFADNIAIYKAGTVISRLQVTTGQ